VNNQHFSFWWTDQKNQDPNLSQQNTAPACFAFASWGPSYKGPGQGQVHLVQAEVPRWATSRLDNLQEVSEEGTPQQWIDLIWDVEEIWTQNSVNGLSDRTSTIRALLKGESLTAFDTALEDVRVDPDPNVQALVPLTVDHIGQAMESVATTVFPHRALEIQKLWMNRGMRKPCILSTCKTAAAISKISNSLPLFPLGNQDSKLLTKNWSDSSNGLFPLIGGRSLT
jgi:hypothetical protein